jgi:hypothetical protein
MKDKTNNTSAISIFGAATATSANGSSSKSESRVTSTSAISVDVAGLIAEGKELLEDASLNASSGALECFRAKGKELFKDSLGLAEQFEKATNPPYSNYRVVNAANPDVGEKSNQAVSHKYALEAVQRGIEFLEKIP